MSTRALLLLPVLVLAAALACLGTAHASGFQADRPLAITSCGQSPDATTLSLLAKRLRLDHRFENMLPPDRIGDVKTLVLVIGASLKGLAEAGTNEERESARVSALLDKAHRQGTKVIGIHMGGESRRGALSDRFIDLVVVRADYLIATDAGNRDGVFTKAAKSRGVPVILVSQPAEVARELRAVFPEQ